MQTQFRATTPLARVNGRTWDLVVGDLWIVDSDLDSRIVSAISPRQPDRRWVCTSATTSDSDLGAAGVQLRTWIRRCCMKCDHLGTEQIVAILKVRGNSVAVFSAVGVELVGGPSLGSSINGQTIMVYFEPVEGVWLVSGGSGWDFGEIGENWALVGRIDGLRRSSIMMPFKGDGRAGLDGEGRSSSVSTVHIAGQCLRANIHNWIVAAVKC